MTVPHAEKVIVVRSIMHKLSALSHWRDIIIHVNALYVQSNHNNKFDFLALLLNT